jgi:hypothetical protein
MYQLLQEEKAALRHVIPRMREVCNNLGVLSGYFSEAEAFTTDLIECCVESGIALLQFLSDIIKFLRNDMPIRHSTTSE